MPEFYPTLRAMQTDICEAYASAAIDFDLAGWVPVGEAYMQALEYDPNDGPAEGKFNLYVNDRFHPSKHGCYLGALLFHAEILGGDSRKLPTGAGSAAAGLGIKPAEAAALQRLARAVHAGEPVAAVGRPVAPVPVAAASPVARASAGRAPAPIRAERWRRRAGFSDRFWRRRGRLRDGRRG